jgi:Ni/Fe-hydrogenase subunit HybB-like protein
MTAICMGYAVVLFESCLTSAVYRADMEVHLLKPLAKVMLGILAVFLVVRIGDLVLRGALGHAFQLSIEAICFWIEMIGFITPLVLLRSVTMRRNPRNLFIAAIALLIGGVFLRLNGFLIGYNTGPGWTYFPSLSEILVTAGIFALEVLGYIVITRRFPVLSPREGAQATH